MSRINNSKVYTIDEIKELLHPIFEEYPIKKAILFGSYSKGKATSKSDVDIIIDSERKLINFRFYGLLEEITVTLNKDIDLIEISEIQEGSPIIQAMNNGIVLYEKQD